MFVSVPILGEKFTTLEAVKVLVKYNDTQAWEILQC